MKKVLIICALLLLPQVLFAQNFAPVVTNVQAQQRIGTKLIDITYDVADADSDTLTISVLVSTDSGQTYSLNAVSITGDVMRVFPGTGKQIVWDAGTDYPSQFGSNFKIKVIVSDHLTSSSLTFTTRTITTSADEARSVFAVDVDSDGDMDVLSASANDNIVAWYENDGSENFSTHTISSDARGAHSVFAIDVDGDGDMDVLSASTKNDRIAWYKNDGLENFSTEIITSSADGAHAVFAIDLDGDSDIDVLSASQFDDKIAWYENDGSESFTAHNIALDADSAKGVFAADVDGDGDMDVLAAAWGNDKVICYRNDGSESFTAETITSSADGVRAVYARDMDGDGDVDVFSASVNDGTTAWYENDGNGNFTAHTITANAQSVRSVYAIDIDGDSDIDVVANEKSNEVVWYENNGSESFSAHTIATNATMVVTVFAADVDGDGDMDILSASQNDDKIAWYENSTTQGDTGFGLSTLFELDTDVPVITTTSLVNAVEDVSYIDTIKVSSQNSNESFTFSILTGPDWLSINNPGILKGVPTNDHVGTEISISIKVSDAAGLSDTLSTTISIINVNDAPVFTTTTLLDGTDGIVYNDTVYANDQDIGDSLKYEIIVAPDWLTLDRTGVLTGTPSYKDIGTNIELILKVTDIEGLSDTLETSISINYHLILPNETNEVIIPSDTSVITRSFTNNCLVSTKFDSGNVANATFQITQYLTISETFPTIPDFNKSLGYYDISLDVDDFQADLTFGYTDSLLNALGIDEDSLAICIYDSVDYRGFIWHSKPFDHEKDNNRVIVRTNHFSLWTVTSKENELISGINTPEGNIPWQFRLFQNSPNPFNPETTIKFDLSKASFVKLEVYNLLGQKVKILLNENKSSGNSQVKWDGTNDLGQKVNSGVYIYKIQAGKFIDSKKMILLK